MRIGILGSGLMGGKLGTLFARAGHEVVFSYARNRSKLEKLARDSGTTARAGSPREATQDADVVLLAVHWSRVDDYRRDRWRTSPGALRLLADKLPRRDATHQKLAPGHALGSPVSWPLWPRPRGPKDMLVMRRPHLPRRPASLNFGA